MCPANWKSRDPGVPETLLIWPKFAFPKVAAGFKNVTLFQTLMQSTSKTKVPMSFGRLKLLRTAASRSWLPGPLKVRGAVRGALPMREMGVLGGETLVGFLNCFESTYGIAVQPVPIPRLHALVPFGEVP